MDSMISQNSSSRRNWVLLFLTAGNSLIFFRHFLASAWVLFGLRQEVVTGSSYQWAIDVRFFAFVAFIFSIIFLISIIRVWFNHQFSKKLVLLCLLFFFLAECYETFMLHITYGPIKIDEVTAYIYGPLVFSWALINARLQGRKAQ